VSDLPRSDIEQALTLMRRLAVLRQSLSASTDRNTRRSIQDEITALTIWLDTIEAQHNSVSR
jgi:hypothetical protein